MAASLKVSLVMLAGIAITLSACNQISDGRSLSEGDWAKPTLRDRSIATPTIATPSNSQPKPNTASYSTKTNQKQTQDKPAAQRGDYKPISLAKIKKTESLKGSDPKEVAIAVFGNTESEGGSREVNVDYPQADQAIVTITQTGVADDSIASIRYRVELVKTNSSPTANSWKIVWAGSQFKCQQGRGHQNWSTKLCL